MPDPTPTTIPALDPEKTLISLQGLILGKTTDNQPRKSELWYAWHYLQVYSVWGQRLPRDVTALKSLLGIGTSIDYPVFATMLERFGDIGAAADTFLNTVFNRIVELGNDMSDFANQATSAGSGNAMFSAISNWIDGSPDEARTAIEALSNLQSMAEGNVEKAGAVSDGLAAYKSTLVKAQANLEVLRQVIESDSRTSQAEIDKLTSTVPGAAGSIATLQGQLESEEEQYRKDVVVAATSPTYAWVFPAGTIAAVTVATVYGVRATKMLDEIADLESQVHAAQQALGTAIQLHRVQQLADTGVSKAAGYTDSAIQHTTTVQNAWNGVSSELNVVMKRIDQMTRETDQGKVLAAKALIKLYLQQADDAWGKLVPPLQDLTNAPYVTVEAGQKSVQDFKADVQKALEAQAR